MTDAELDALEKAATLNRPDEDWHQEVLALVAEVRRLRGAIARSRELHPGDCVAVSEYNARPDECTCPSQAALAAVLPAATGTPRTHNAA